MSEKKLLTVEQVALRVGCSAKTINLWYQWKRTNPLSKYVELLPEYTRSTSKGQRLWDPDAVWSLIEFRRTIPHGRNGIMGSVSQKYMRNRRSKNAENDK